MTGGATPDKFMHVWEGEYSLNSEARVFRNWKVEDSTRPKDAVHRFGAGTGALRLIRPFWSGATSASCSLTRSSGSGLRDRQDARAFGHRGQPKVLDPGQRPTGNGELHEAAGLGYARDQGAGINRRRDRVFAASTSWCIRVARTSPRN